MTHEKDENVSAVDLVIDAIERSAISDRTSSESLARIEDIANRFAHIKPVPYRVPIERFAGLSFQDENNT